MSSPTSHEPLATIFPPLLPNRGGPPDRFRRGHPVSLLGPSGADQQEAQDGCQNGQLWLGVPLWESREMLFGENAIRGPPVAVRKTMPHGPVMYITIKKAVARCSWFVARKTMPHGPVMYITIYSRRAAQGSLYRGADRQRRSERLKIGPYDAAIRPQKQATSH